MNLNSTVDIVTVAEQVNNLASQYPGSNGRGVLNPEVFYNKQLLDTIRIDADQYCYYRLADPMPIGDKADKLQLRRWSPLQAHTVPLVEGIPPRSDKGSVEKYEINAAQYGRYMEFSDKVDFTIVDPMIAIYTKEYSIVAVETLDMLAREALLANCNPNYAGGAAGPEELTLDSKPSLEDLRKIILNMKRQLVKPRNNGRFHVIGSPEFYYDMIKDPLVEQYMTINNTTKSMYDNARLVPLFEMEFYETLVCPTSEDFYVPNKKGSAIKKVKILHVEDEAAALDQKVTISAKQSDGTYDITGYKDTSNAVVVADIEGALYAYRVEEKNGNTTVKTHVYAVVALDDLKAKPASYIDYQAVIDAQTGGLLNTTDPEYANRYGSYVLDSRTGQKASYIPGDVVTVPTGWQSLKAHNILILGKDALARTGLSGQDQAKMYVKEKGSAGVLDPIDQRQSIGFKINSVGFGVIRSEAVQCYVCVPSQSNF